MHNVRVTVNPQGGDMVKEDEFKYLESSFQRNEHLTREVKKRARVGWVDTSVRGGLICCGNP